MAIATRNLTVSREAYDAILRRKEELRDYRDKSPSLNDAVESFICGSLVVDKYEKKRNCRRAPEDRIFKEIVRTIK